MTSSWSQFISKNIGAVLAQFDVSRHDNRIGLILAVNISFIVLAALVVALRVFTRLVLVRHFGWDDVFMVLAGIFQITLCALPLAAIPHGLGLHLWDIDRAPHPDALKILLMDVHIAIIYSITICLVKVSIIFSYFRLFPYPWLNNLMRATLVLVVCMAICGVIIPNINTMNVAGYLQFGYVSAAINILTDFILCLTPLPVFWKLQLNRRDKIIVCLLFACGLFASVCSILRLIYLPDLEHVDFTFSLISPEQWSIIEVGAGILCASVPSLKPLAARLFPRSFLPTALSDHSSNGTSNGQSNESKKPPPGSSSGSESTVLAEDGRVIAKGISRPPTWADAELGTIMGTGGYAAEIVSTPSPVADEEKKIGLTWTSSSQQRVGIERTFSVDTFDVTEAKGTVKQEGV